MNPTTHMSQTLFKHILLCGSPSQILQLLKKWLLKNACAQLANGLLWSSAKREEEEDCSNLNARLRCAKQDWYLSILQAKGRVIPNLIGLVSTLQRLIYIRFFCSAGFALAKLALIWILHWCCFRSGPLCIGLSYTTNIYIGQTYTDVKITLISSLNGLILH